MNARLLISIVAVLMLGSCSGRRRAKPATQHDATAVTAAKPADASNAAQNAKPLSAPQIRRQLVAMAREDQAVRKQFIAAMKKNDKATMEKLRTAMVAVDRKNTAALEQLVAAHGWLTESMVGWDGAHDAWLLAQHADANLAFQKDVLARMKPLVKSGEIWDPDYAYLYDRVATAEHRKQRYGTQFANGEPMPIEDEAHVDERRDALGMGPLADYRKMMQESSGQQK